jgi:hypothetical protein
MFHRLTTHALQLDARFVAWKLLAKPGWSRWVLPLQPQRRSCDVHGPVQRGNSPSISRWKAGAITAMPRFTSRPLALPTGIDAIGGSAARAANSAAGFSTFRTNRPTLPDASCLGLRHASEFLRGDGEIAAPAKALYLVEKAGG